MPWAETVKGMTLAQVARASYRKFILRRAVMGMYGVRAGDAQAPDTSEWQFEIRSAQDVAADELSNPYLSEEDVEEFRRHPAAVCLIARKGTDVAGSVWALQRTAFVHELGHEIELAPGSHYLCRASVGKEYQGHSLHAAMLYEYGRRQSFDATICGLMYDWNIAPIRNAQKVGWTKSATYWSVWIFGIRFSGVRPVANGGRR